MNRILVFLYLVLLLLPACLNKKQEQQIEKIGQRVWMWAYELSNP